MVFGIDIGTTSVAGVAVGSDGRVVASTTVAHQADLPSNGHGIDEQDPLKLLSAVEAVQANLQAQLPDGDRPQEGDCPPIGYKISKAVDAQTMKCPACGGPSSETERQGWQHVLRLLELSAVQAYA